MTCKLNADTSDGLKIVSDTSGEIDLQIDGTTKVHMDSGGQIGIGTTSPSGSLHINTSSANILIADTDDSSGSYSRVLGVFGRLWCYWSRWRRSIPRKRKSGYD